MEIGSFYVQYNSIATTRNIKVFHDFTGRLFYKFKKRNDKECKEYQVIYCLMDLPNKTVNGFPYVFVGNDGRHLSIKYLMDNNNYTYTFELKSFDLQQSDHICILSQEYKNQEVKDAWVYGLKRNLTDLEKYKVFKTIEDFDIYIKNDFNIYKNINVNKETEINTYDTVKQCVDEVNDYVKNVLNKTINGKKQLTPYNLLEEVVSYYIDTDMESHVKCMNKEPDIVEVVKEMLLSKEYILSDDFKNNKLDLKDIQFKFKMLTSPETISKDEILAEVFNIDNSVSLI